MPWPVHPTGFLGARGDSDTYRIERSLRFNSADSAYLTRTFSGTPYTYTLSWWVKRGALSSDQVMFGSRQGASNPSYVEFLANNTITIILGVNSTVLTTTSVFRDPSAWYHFVLSVTASGASYFYVNGIQVGTWTSSATPYLFNSSYTNAIGRYGDSATLYFNGYMAEINFIDGQALTPSSFGETDAITGRWKAKAYSGTYGTNGFYLSFKDNTSTTTLGYDDAGSNDWTLNNFSVTAGAGNDSLVDSPTNYGSGIATVGNFCTWNPLINGDSAANGNLDVTNDTARGNHELMKYDAYWEVTSTGGTCLAGIVSTAATSTVTVGSAKTFGFKLSEAGVFEYANITDGSSFTSQATATTPPFPYASTGASITASLNCGQRAFAGTLPTGYKPICTTSLDQPTIQKPSKYMDALAYTGTGASNAISSLGFSPDLVWIKNRGTTTSHAIYDTTRGTQAQLSSDSTGAEVTSSTGLTEFGSNGFTIGTSSLVNTSGTQYVAWSWDESAKGGLDIVGYVGDGSAGKTVSHNLGVAPKMIIVKNRTTGGFDWVVYHQNMNASPQGGYLGLNATYAFQSNTTIWNNTAPSSSVFTLGTNTAVNKSGDNHIAYCFAEIEGYSKFGSYTGNNSADGPFIWCGFRPRWVIIKRIDANAKPWCIHDTGRDISNVSNSELEANSSTAENGGTYPGDLDILSNGFKLREAGTGAWINEPGNFIFAAFAESPFKYARAR